MSLVKEIPHAKLIVDICFFGQKDVLVSALKSGDLHFWNIKTGKTILFFPVNPNITAISFSKSGNYMAMGFLEGDFTVHE